jgi:hypothetical protein
MITLDLSRFQPTSHWTDGPGAANEHWCFAHPSMPYVTLALVSRVRGEVTVSIASCSFLHKRSANGTRMAAEVLLAACEFASNLEASHPIEQPSRVGNGIELDGQGMKSADGPSPHPSPEPPHSSGTNMIGTERTTSEPERAQAYQAHSLVAEVTV